MTAAVEARHDRPLPTLTGIARSALSYAALYVLPASELRVLAHSDGNGGYCLTAARLGLA